MPDPIALPPTPDAVLAPSAADRAAFVSGAQSFVPGLLPEAAMRLPIAETMRLLRARWGEAVDLALQPTFTDPDHPPAVAPLPLRGPLAGVTGGDWLKRVNMVGVNVRTIGSFWNLVNYALTLPAAQNSIHILPIWEPGVVSSLYGMSGWGINPEFRSDQLAWLAPWLYTVERQLRAVVNLLHVMGFTVGMDVIPHTDRFSEMALAYPEHFEWLRREGTTIVDYAPTVHEQVQARIIAFLAEHGSASPRRPTPRHPAELFHPTIPEGERLRILFGAPADHAGRLARRRRLIRWLYQDGYETMPATMAPPYRGLAVDPRPLAEVTDDDGLVWRDYLITEPQPMSRVFGPLTRYRLYERVADPTAWALDFERPNVPAWDYVCGKYAEMQRRYGFDFMRGDMAHVQMRPEGVPAAPDPFYDILGAVKNYIQRHNQQPAFGYFAESFLAPPDVMGYGVEIDHLEASDAESTLGDLQSTVVGSPEFLQRFRAYHDLLVTRRCAPNFTVMTADKDDPRFDLFYLTGNELRLFIALFLTDMPSYMALGFESRDPHPEPAPNEHYTKLFVFHETRGPKATTGPYRWGQNHALFQRITALRHYLDGVWPLIREQPTRWLIPPDATAGNPIVAWTQAAARPTHLFVANTDTQRDALRFAIPLVAPGASLVADFSTHAATGAADERLSANGKGYHLTRLAAGEGRVYRVDYLDA